MDIHLLVVTAINNEKSGKRSLMSRLESDSTSDVSDWQGCQKQQLESIVILSTLNTFFLPKATFLCILHLPLGCLWVCLYCKAVLLVHVVGGNNWLALCHDRFTAQEDHLKECFRLLSNRIFCVFDLEEAACTFLGSQRMEQKAGQTRLPELWS